MLKTIDHVEGLLTNHGYTTTRMLDLIVATTVPTKTYTNTAGEKAIELVITFDKSSDCLVVAALRAFDLRKTVHKEATLACLLAATARAPFLCPSLDPVDGEIRLRIDCPCGTRGARDGDLLKAVTVLPWFADIVSPQILAAMEKGSFDPNQVPPFYIPKPKAKQQRVGKPTGDAPTPAKKQPQAADPS